MSWKQSDVDSTKWSIIFVFLWTLTEVKSYPCANVPCITISQDKDGSVPNLNSRWATAPGNQGSITQAKAGVGNKITYLMQTTADMINKQLGFFENISEQPLKIILVIGLSLALLIISSAIIRKCYKYYHSLSVKNQAFAMIVRIGKSQHTF